MRPRESLQNRFDISAPREKPKLLVTVAVRLTTARFPATGTERELLRH